MAKRKPLEHIFKKKQAEALNLAKPDHNKRKSIDEKKEIEAYLKKIKDKLKKDPKAQKKAAMIISLMLNDKSR